MQSEACMFMCVYGRVFAPQRAVQGSGQMVWDLTDSSVPESKSMAWAVGRGARYSLLGLALIEVLCHCC